MSLLSMDGVCKAFGEQEVLCNITFGVAHGERMGVVGPNGVGKTTLLELAARELEPDQGKVNWAGGLRVGYLRQEIGDEPEVSDTLYSYCGAALREIWQLEEEMQSCEEEMARTTDEQSAAPLLKDYDELRTRYENLEGYTARSRLHEALFGVGFVKGDFAIPARSLSGGQRVRAALARLLLFDSDLLLLDEPTNHLDIEAIEWLENWLSLYSGAVLMVAHDRRFLDRATNRTLELRGNQATVFTGNYSSYELQRRERDERAQAEFERKQETASRLTDYIRRYQAGNRATMAKSRVRALERLGPLEAPPSHQHAPRMDFSTKFRSAREVFQLRGVGFGYPEKQLFSDLDLTIRRGQRLGIVGPNGCGKTTLLRLLAGEMEPGHGSLYVGGGVKVAYYSQTGTEELPSSSTALAVVTEQGVDNAAARHLLARLGLQGEDVFKRVDQLSGGQKSRLLLACLVLTKANVLLMDEPTNHLDLLARDALQEALGEFGGTLILVTHDRYLLDQLVEHLVIFSEGRFHYFAGNYSAYRAEKEINAAMTAATPSSRQPVRRREVTQSAGGSVKAARVGQQAELEASIASLEHEKKVLENQLADPELYGQLQAADKVRAYHSLSQELEAMYRKWEEALSHEEE